MIVIVDAIVSFDIAGEYLIVLGEGRLLANAGASVWYNLMSIARNEFGKAIMKVK